VLFESNWANPITPLVSPKDRIGLSTELQKVNNIKPRHIKPSILSAMVSTRQRAKAAAALGLAASSLSADAFLAGSSGSGSGNTFAFAPAHAQPRWLVGPQPASASSFSGRAHRFYVRDRDGGGFESSQRWKRPAGTSAFRAAPRGGAFGSRRGSCLSMASSDDGVEVSASAVSGAWNPTGSALVYKLACVSTGARSHVLQNG